MTDENQYVVLKYFYVLKHEQNNRQVNWSGVFNELSPQLNGVNPQKARSWWTKHGYIDDKNDLFFITEKGENAFKALDANKNNTQKRKENEDEIQELTKISLGQSVSDFRKSKTRANASIIISIVAVAATLIVPYIEHKIDDTDSQIKQIQKEIKTQQKDVRSLDSRLQDDFLSLSRTKSYIDSLRRRIDTLEAKSANK